MKVKLQLIQAADRAFVYHSACTLIARQSRVQRALVDKQVRAWRKNNKIYARQRGDWRQDVPAWRPNKNERESIAKRRIEVGYWITPEKKSAMVMQFRECTTYVRSTKFTSTLAKIDSS